ncbi:sugar-binding transcriptional regulator [Schleiferilactobacillus perolens]|jgi:DNA-binding transcriptional regulator LsrR (DeoR family)|uniref:sugar-binding transcriptional regulator n=1 Tax=Schleiferilactobacillus perolens TaxID=100468 RepID=UPI002357B2F2|nr:sugar-binding domain-containing protein [Schleiferilactobacillus perolens]MCI1890539.1 sugar-binding transcriptional regulator [Schleiferilactobacillus harbinensis]MCI1911694.1 sugar-binding transcriptional regulator [Schleiferilactobacillus harbinensis]MCI2171946.1 sugar-binding transcriptional regulator [Schleiferilactobacillus perolens]
MATQEHQALLTAIAQDYYFSRASVSELAEKYHITRYFVEKYLQEAQASGLVTITIQAPTTRLQSLELKFKQAFAIPHLVIIKDAANPTQTIEHVVTYAAQQVQNLIHAQNVVGLSWGATIYDVIQHFSADNQPGLTFTQYMGENMKYHSRAGSTRMVEMAANKFSANYQTIVGPLYVFNPTVRTMLTKEPALAPAFALCEKLDLIICGIGTMDSIDSIPVWHQHRNEIVPADQIENVAGVLFGRPYDVQGRLIAPDKSPLFGISETAVRAVPRRVGIVTSKFKTRATLGALRGGMLTDLVMSEAVANRIAAEAAELQ